MERRAKKVVLDDGNIILICGDCRTIMPGLKNVTSVVMDPPYGTENKAGYGRKQNYGGAGRTIIGDADTSLIMEVCPLIKKLCPVGWVAMFFSGRNIPDVVDATRALPWYGHLVWEKSPGLGFPIQYAHENVALFCLGDAPPPKDSIVSVRRDSMRRHARISHPHAKPMFIMRELVKFAAAESGALLDPLMGTGTTGAACVEARIPFIGIEIDPTIFDAGCDYIKQALIERNSHIGIISRPPPGHRRRGGRPVTSLFKGE